MADGRHWLFAAAWMSLAAAALHLACIVGGASWYRALGAGERIARQAERGLWEPAIIAAGIAGVLMVWAAYAFSAAGAIPRLPLLRTALVLISLLLLARALAVPVMQSWRPDLSAQFIYVSAAIVFLYGATFAIGTWLAWPLLLLKDYP